MTGSLGCRNWPDRCDLVRAADAPLTSSKRLAPRGVAGTWTGNMTAIFRYMRDFFEDARIVDPANTNNVISDDLTKDEKAKIRAAAIEALAATRWERRSSMKWSLKLVLQSMHEDIEHRLGAVRRSFQHPGTLGDASETVWLDLLQTYLPRRYSAASAHVVDSKGKFSEQIDIVIFDRQYTPFIFYFAGKAIVPAEGVYAVLEAKQSINGPGSITRRKRSQQCER